MVFLAVAVVLSAGCSVTICSASSPNRIFDIARFPEEKDVVYISYYGGYGLFSESSEDVKLRVLHKIIDIGQAGGYKYFEIYDTSPSQNGKSSSLSLEPTKIQLFKDLETFTSHTRIAGDLCSLGSPDFNYRIFVKVIYSKKLQEMSESHIVSMAAVETALSH